LYGAETWTVGRVDQKYLKSFEMRCWGRMETVGQIILEIKKYYIHLRRGRISYEQ